MAFFNNRNDDDLFGSYMTECPRCHHRYNKRLHYGKCPDCGYRGGLSKYLPFIVVTVIVLIILLKDVFFAIFNPVYMIIGANIILFMLGFNGSNYQEYGNCYYETIVRKQYIRLLTSGFSHANIMHLACNCVSLYNFGFYALNVLGYVKFIVLYFVSLLVGNLLSTIIHHNMGDDYVYEVGASGAICGLFGVVIVLALKAHINIFASSSIMISIISMIIPSFYSNVDVYGHLCGLVVGIVVSFLLLI